MRALTPLDMTQFYSGQCLFARSSPQRTVGWMKAVLLFNLVKGAGTFESYTTWTLLDGSMFVTYNKGKIGGTPQGQSESAKITGDIIHGTGRFQGIKGTITQTTKMLPPEKGEIGQKAVSEGTMDYTLPGK